MGRSKPRASTTRHPASTCWKWSEPAPEPKERKCPSSGALAVRKNIMAHSIVMPALEMAQETGKLLAWRKKEGDTIAKGEPLLDVETDKAVVEIESPADGILAGVKAHAGDVIPVGQTIAWIVQPGEKPPAESDDMATGRRMETKPSAPAHVAAAKTSCEPAPAATGRISPKARR